MSDNKESTNILSQLNIDISNSNNTDCDKGWHDGSCCCNCQNHYEDFYHCITSPKPKGIDGCVCSVHKGWICIVTLDGEQPRARSNWVEHGMCEFHIRR